MNENRIQPADVIGFWQEVGEDKWYEKNPDFDVDVTTRFKVLHKQAAAGEKDAWAETADGALALLLLLDQFSRNMFRGSPKTFAQDAKARDIAERAIAARFDMEIDPPLRQFFYLPFMHSEAIADQERCVALCHSLPGTSTLPFARDHERIVRRFGRFPHRNTVLGRHTSPAEQAFLDGGGFGG